MRNSILMLALASLIFSSGCKKELVDTSLNDIEDVTGVEKFNNTIASGVTMAFFHADWCRNCEEIRPTVEAVSKDADLDFAQFIEVNYDDNTDVFEDKSVPTFPQLLFFVDGEEKSRLKGKSHSQEAIAAELEKYRP
jgi:thiol-disulfide isomerase/thioredoxin